MAKYDADQLKELGAKGHAFKNPDGSYSYPIEDVDDLQNAIHAVGRGGSDHDAIRKYIIGRAKDLGHADAIPDDWNADGSLKQTNSQQLGRVKKRRHRSGPPLGREFRRFAADGLEVRSAADGSDQIEITGMPIVYNTPYTVRDMFGEFEETMLPGVASDVLSRGADVRFLFNHDGMPLARTTSGTLRLMDTPAGLRMQAFVDARMQIANDLAVAIERGDVSQMSCGFVVARDDWSDDFTQRSIRQLQELFDVSSVTYPASPTTSVELALRSMYSQPVETQARTRQLWVTVGKDLREGRALTEENAGLLQQALEALHQADVVDIPAIVQHLQNLDEALDAGQAALADAAGVENPDGGPGDLEPELCPADDDDDDIAEAFDEMAGQMAGALRNEIYVHVSASDDAAAALARLAGAAHRAAESSSELADAVTGLSAEARAANVIALELEAEQMRLRGRRHRA
jgi:HK97 family phage prohead protease